VAIYVPSLFDLNRAQAALTGAIPDFIEANVVWGGWWLTEAWLTTAIFDAVYTLSKTDLPYVRELRWLMHLAVGIGFFMLTYSYFAPYINKIIATNQTQPSNQTS
jgi:vacuolar-type H+-ATPase subunit I/STV1